MAIGFFFTGKDNQVVQLPVNPATLDVECEGTNETINLVGIGDTTILRAPGLKTINIESFFPRHPGPYLSFGSTWTTADSYVAFFNGVMEGEAPIAFVVSECGINMLVTVEGFNHSRDNDDVSYTLSLKEYRPYTVKRIELPPEDEALVSAKPSTADSSTTRSSTTKSVTIGCTVIVNGRVHVDSYGNKPGTTLSNYKGKVNHIKEGRSHPYHITSTVGKSMGWVTKAAVEVIDSASSARSKSSSKSTSKSSSSSASKPSATSMPTNADLLRSTGSLIRKPGTSKPGYDSSSSANWKDPDREGTLDRLNKSAGPDGRIDFEFPDFPGRSDGSQTGY